MCFKQKPGRQLMNGAAVGGTLALVGMGCACPARAQAPPAAPPIAPAPSGNVPRTVLPFTLQGNAISVSVPLTQFGEGDAYRVPESTKPLQLQLDTGADTVLLAEEALTARHISLPPPGKDDAVFVGGSGNGGIPARIVPGVKMMLGSITVQGKVVVASMKPMVQFGTDGVLGAEIFRALVVEVDYAAKAVRLFSPETFVPPAPNSGFVSLPIRFVGPQKRPVIAVEVTPNGLNKTTANLQIDTGLGGTILFNAPFVARSGWEAFEAKTVPAAALGVDGLSTQRNGRLKEIKLGGIALAQPYALFSFDKKVATVVEESDGLIGGEIFRRFTVIFDYSRNTMYLRPNTAFAKPFRSDYFGFVPDFSTIRNGGWPILSVDENSPAARAGIKKGEFIVAVNKRPVADFMLDSDSDPFDDAKSGAILFTIRAATGEKTRDVRVKPVAL